MVAEADASTLARTDATVGQLLERRFEQAKEDFSPKTVLETRGFLDRNLLPGLGHVPLAKLKPDALDRYYRRCVPETGTVEDPWPRPPSGASTASCAGPCPRVCGGVGWRSTRPRRHRLLESSAATSSRRLRPKWRAYSPWPRRTIQSLPSTS
jgi:hypothetical protein